MKTLTIGDIHGRDNWMKLTHRSVRSFELWKISVENGASVDPEMWPELPYSQFDRIIFVGDYVDSFDKSNKEIRKNLENIIFFKKMLGDKVVLLWGNHDLQYIYPNMVCSGFRPEMRFDLDMIFRENKSLFKFAHQEKEYLWTHAGVSSGWFNFLLKTLGNTKHRFHDIIKVFLYKSPEKTIADILNFAGELRSYAMFTIDVYSCGMDKWAGPLWVRPEILSNWPLENFNQIVGHTAVPKVKRKKHKNGSTIWYVDCLESNKGLKLDI